MGRFEDADEAEDAERGRNGGDGGEGVTSSAGPPGPSSSSSAPMGRHRRPPAVRTAPGTGFLSKALAVVIGLLFFTIGTRYSHWFGRLTPVYAKVQCWSQAANLEEFVVGAKAIHMGLVVNITCANPNPYAVLVQPILGNNFGGTGATVYVGTFPMAIQAGRFVIAATELPPGSGGLVQALASVDLHGPDAEELLPHFLEDDNVPVTMRMEFLVLTEVRLGLAKFEADALFKEDCGLHVRGLFSRSYEPKTGMSHAAPPVSQMVCGKTWASIAHLMPELGEEESPGRPGQDGEDFMAATLAPADARRASLTKLIGLGTLIASSYFFGAVVSAYLWFIGGPWDRQGRSSGGYKSPGAAGAPPPLEQPPAGARAAAGEEERMMTKGLMEREETGADRQQVTDATADEEMKRFVDVT